LRAGEGIGSSNKKYGYGNQQSKEIFFFLNILFFSQILFSYFTYSFYVSFF